MKKFALLLAAGLLLAACAAEPIYNVVNHPIPAASAGKPLAEIQDIIVRAGQSRGWMFQQTGPGRLHAVQNQPKFSADVDVTFDQNSYSISHSASRGMKEANGMIHPHYNFWVRNLENDIQVWLTNAGLAPAPKK